MKQKEIIKGNKLSRDKKTWREEEDEKLIEYWGEYSVAIIAKKLERTEDAVRTRGSYLGLGRHIDNSDLIPFGTLLREFKVENSYSQFSKKFIDAGFRFHTQKVKKNSFRMVDIAEFWEFIEKHREFFDFSKLEENSFGIEPEWVKKQRSEDFRRKAIKTQHYSSWTEKDEKELLRLVRLKEYSYAEIAKRLMRSENAIRRRLHILKEKERPFSNASRKWTEEDLKTIDSMLRAGKRTEEISFVLNQSSRAIVSKISTLYSGMGIREIRKKLRNGEDVASPFPFEQKK